MLLLSTVSIATLMSASSALEATSMDEDNTQDIEEVKVIAFPAAPQKNPSPITAPPAADSADFLRQIPGISAGRFGGHSLEPVLRGQQQGQLTVMNNGSLQLGSGPNRMDTPSTYAAIDLIDTVVIVKGYQSVLNGPGGSGGIIMYERNIPEVSENLEVKGLAGAGYETNGDVKRSFTRTTVSKGNLALEAWGSLQEADSYKDGSGKLVRSAFNDYAIGGALTYRSESGNYIQFGYDWNKMTDALFPGAGMDSSLSGGDTYRVRGEADLGHDVVEALRYKASYAHTKHYMDNFNYRMNMGMMMESRTSTKAYNAEVEADVRFGNMLWTLVGDYRDITNDGSRFTGMNANMLNRTQANMWPHINTNIVGVGAEHQQNISDDLRITYGVRTDWVDVSWGRANELPQFTMMGMMPMSANMIYMTYYNTMAKDVSENHFSGVVKAEWRANDNWSFFSSVSKSERTANATERGFANLMMMNGMNASWVGNPTLRPEQHHQVDVGGLYKTDNWEMTITTFFDQVDDFILRDSARGQEGIYITAPMADVYRNIDAFLMGFEMAAEWRTNTPLSFKMNAAYVHGRDEDRNKPLAQIPPLQGALSAHWTEEKWEVSATMLYAADQGRVDLNPMMGTGRDPRKTPEYAVFNLVSRYDLTNKIRLQVGVNNLFDKSFADHLSRSNLLDATEIQVNEPGRRFYGKLVARF